MTPKRGKILMKKKIGLRKCLNCGKEFLSTGPGNRICSYNCTNPKVCDPPKYNNCNDHMLPHLGPIDLEDEYERRDSCVLYMERLKDENQELSEM
jgi:hypothetical protein